MSIVLDLKKKKLEGEISLLCEQYTAVSRKILTKVDEAEKVLLEKQAEDILQDIGDKERTLKQVEQELSRDQMQAVPGAQATGDFYRQHQNKLKQWLPYIDFKSAREEYHRVLRRFDDSQGVALFLLHSAIKLRGDWCVRRFKAELQKREDIHFRAFELEFIETAFDELGLKKKLAGHLGFESSPQNLEMTAIIETIYKMLLKNSVLFFEIRVPDNPFADESFFEWFLDEFWLPLVNKLKGQERKYPLVKFICVIVVEPEIPVTHLQMPQICEPPHFSKDKFLLLPLAYWNQTDIYIWLVRLLSKESSAETDEIIEKLADQFYRNSENGIPNQVVTQIERWWDRRVKAVDF